jgi:hypothetical protein
MIEEPPNIRFHDPVHFLVLNRLAQGFQRIVTSAFRPISVTAIQKIGFVNCTQTRVTAICTTLSSTVGMPSGRFFLLPAFGMYVRRTGWGR